MEIDTRSMLNAAANAAASAGGANDHNGESRTLSAAALALASQHVPPAYSPIVLAGVVRLIESALIAIIGAAIYLAYVVPIDGFSWPYPALIAGISVLTLLAFQAADIYHV